MKEPEISFLERNIPNARALRIVWSDEDNLEGLEAEALSFIVKGPRVVIGLCGGGPLALILAERLSAEKLILISAPALRRDIHLIFLVFLMLSRTISPTIAKVVGQLLFALILRISNGRFRLPRVWASWKRNQMIARSFLSLGNQLPANFRVERIIGRSDYLIKGEDCPKTTLLQGGHFLLKDCPIALLKVLRRKCFFDENEVRSEH